MILLVIYDDDLAVAEGLSTTVAFLDATHAAQYSIDDRRVFSTKEMVALLTVEAGSMVANTLEGMSGNTSWNQILADGTYSCALLVTVCTNDGPCSGHDKVLGLDLLLTLAAL